jgi:hypothetical protein
MNEQNNLPQKQITDLATYKSIVEKGLVPAKTKNYAHYKLKDYEEFFVHNYQCRYNTLTMTFELGQNVIEQGELDEKMVWEEMIFEEVLNDMNRFGAKDRGRKDVSEKELTNILKDRRIVPEYDPLNNYFENLGVKYSLEEVDGAIDDLASYVTVEGGTEAQERWKEHFKKALVRTVKCALNPLYFNKQCLTLFSSGQSKGKTSFLRALSPTSLYNYFYDEPISTDKDGQLMLTRSFIVLQDELAALSRLDINNLKAIMSKSTVNVRAPYERKARPYPRRCSIFATTNRADILSDTTNVRWLIFDVREIDMSYGNVFTGDFKVDIDRVWAEAYKLYLENWNCELSIKDMEDNEVNNLLYSSIGTERDIIDQLFIPATYQDKDKKGYERAQPSGIYERTIELLLEDGREHIADVLKRNSNRFYTELSRAKGWKKVSLKLDDGRTVAGYHYLVKKLVDKNELF